MMSDESCLTTLYEKINCFFAIPTHIMKTDILTKELICFIEELRQAGYNIGINQFTATQDLILALVAQGQLPLQLSRLKTLLAPILCHSPKEQAEFQYHFDNWLNQVEGATSPQVKTFSNTIHWQAETASIEISKHHRLQKWFFVPFIVIGLIGGSFIYLSSTKTPSTPEISTASDLNEGILGEELQKQYPRLPRSPPKSISLKRLFLTSDQRHQLNTSRASKLSQNISP